MHLLYFVFIFVIISVSLFTNTITLLFPFSIFLILIVRLLKGEQRIYKDIGVFSYLYYSIIGVINYAVYLYYCGRTFAPYGDDSFYYKNILDIISGSEATKAGLYEYCLAVLVYPIKLFFNYDVKHWELLPINWFMGGLVVLLAVKFANTVLSVNLQKSIWISALIVLFNACFTDGIVHLYRDSFMCFLLLNSLMLIYKNRYIGGGVYAFLLGFVRGANAAIAFVYLCLSRFVKTNIDKKIYMIVVLSLLLIAIVLVPNLGIERYLRSFSADSSAEIYSFGERISDFRNQENASGMVLSMLKSSNPILHFLAIPFYMISPITIGDFFINEFYDLRYEGWDVFRLRIESMWECLMILFYPFIITPLFCGLYYWYRDRKIANLNILVTFLLTLVLVTLISMQSRHKMAFIVLFPLAYNYYLTHASFKTRLTNKYISVLVLFVVLFYNIVF